MHKDYISTNTGLIDVLYTWDVIKDIDVEGAADDYETETVDVFPSDEHKKFDINKHLESISKNNYYVPETFDKDDEIIFNEKVSLLGKLATKNLIGYKDRYSDSPLLDPESELAIALKECDISYAYKPEISVFKTKFVDQKVMDIHPYDLEMINNLTPFEQTPVFDGDGGVSEDTLKSEFSTITQNMSVEDALKLQPDRKIPKNIQDFSFVGLKHAGRIMHSSDSAGHSIVVPSGVTCNYDGGDLQKRPYLDSNYAIGLTYRGTLAAVAAAQIQEDGKLRIVQLQAVDSSAKDPKLKFKTGLHSGFYWRDTLVQAWINIAPQLAINTVEIQGADNNRWKQENRMDQLRSGYDGVASRMGFEHNTETSNWSLDISREEDSAAA